MSFIRRSPISNSSGGLSVRIVLIDAFCIRADQVTDDDAYLSASTTEVGHFSPVILWRDVHRQAVNKDCVDMHGFSKKVGEGGLKTKFANLEKRLNPCFPRVRIGRAENFSPLPSTCRPSATQT